MMNDRTEDDSRYTAHLFSSVVIRLGALIGEAELSYLARAEVACELFPLAVFRC